MKNRQIKNVNSKYTQTVQVQVYIILFPQTGICQKPQTKYTLTSHQTPIIPQRFQWVTKDISRLHPSVGQNQETYSGLFQNSLHCETRRMVFFHADGTCTAQAWPQT